MSSRRFGSLLRDPRVVVARRDLSSLGREKTIVLALLIQLFVAAFSSFLVVGLTSLYDPSAVESGEIEIGVAGDARADLLVAAREEPGVDAIPFDDPTEALAAFDDGRVDAVLTGQSVPAADGAGRAIHVEVTVPSESIRTTLIVVQVRNVLSALERHERIERADHLEHDPVPLPPQTDASPYFGFTYTVLVPLLLFLPPFISGSVAVDTVTEEIEQGTLELLRVAPVTLLDVVDGKALAMVVLAPAQALLWIVLLGGNGIPVSHPLALLTLVTAVAIVLVAFGVLLGLELGRRRQAQLLYSVLALLAFGAAVFLPEHPTTTAAKLAVDSPTTGTYGHVVGFVVVATVLYVATRRYVRGISAETL